MIACTAEKLTITEAFVIKCQFFWIFVFFALGTAATRNKWIRRGIFVILAAVKQDIVIGLFAALTLILGAGYSLLLVKKVFYGEVSNNNVMNLVDVNNRELILLVIFSLFILLLGLKPDLITNVTEASITNLVDHVGRGKAY